MKLRVILPLALLLAVLAALPYVSGQWIESGYQRQLALLASPSAANLQLHNDGYQRGWFESRVRTAIDLVTPEGEQRIVLVHWVEHGPAIGLYGLARIHSHIEFPVQMQADVMDLFDGREPLTALTMVDFDGVASTTINAPSLDKVVHDRQGEALNLRWDGLEGELSSNVSTGVAQLQLRLGQLEVVGEERQLQLTPVTVDASMRHQSQGLWSGDSQMKMAGLSLSGLPDVGEISMQDIVVANRQQLENGQVFASGAVDIRRLSVAGVPAENIGYELSFSRLDADALVALNHTLGALLTAEAEQGRVLSQEIQPQVVALLGHQPEFAIERLHFDAVIGRMNSHLKIKYRGDPENLSLLADPAMLVRDVDVDLAIDASKALVMMALHSAASQQVMQAAARMEEPPGAEAMQEQTAALATQQLQLLLAQNWLQENADGYSTSIVLQGGHLSINAQPADYLLGMVPSGDMGPTP